MKWRLSVLMFLAGLWGSVLCPPRRFHLVRGPLPWSEARSLCRERYADLATVADAHEMERLVAAARGSGLKAWIGLRGDPGGWRWSLSDRRLHGNEYSNWDAGQPDNALGDQMCVMMRLRGTWDDFQCDWRAPFVCYRDSADPAQRLVLVQEPLSWSGARRFCRDRHWDLASVRNHTENQEIQRLTDNRDAWIGLHRSWEWSDRSDSEFRHWKAGQPDDSRPEQSCVATDLGNAGLWSDEPCSSSLDFICYGEQTSSNSTIAAVTPREASSTEAPGQTKPEHVIKLKVKLSSKKHLSEDDVENLVSVKFRDLLVETGLPESIKVGLDRT